MDDIVYSFKIMGLKKIPSFNGLNDVIISVDFIVSAEITGLPKFEWALGDVPVDIPTNAENFKLFSELTEEDIIGWVQNSQPIAHVKDNLRRSINEHFANKQYVAWDNRPSFLETGEVIEP